MRHIKSLEDILDVATTSNAVRLAKEIEQFLFEYARNVEIFRQQNPEITKGLKNSQIIKGSFKRFDEQDI